MPMPEPTVIRREIYTYVPPRGRRLDYGSVHVPDGGVVVPFRSVTFEGQYVFNDGSHVQNVDLN